MLHTLVSAMQARAAMLDEMEAFPADDIADLRDAGVLAQAPQDPAALFDLLRKIGCGNLSVGRLIEAHVNALLLTDTYAMPDFGAEVRRDAAAGHLFGLWVTDQGEPVRLENGSLTGRKGPCSGAGHVTRAVITVDTAAGTHLAVIDTAGLHVVPMRGVLPGMRAAMNGVVTLDGTTAKLFGAPGDYLREPLLSVGAWRTSAVTLGGLDALVDAARTTLLRRGHDAHPLQQDRFGRTVIAQQTARMWAARAAAEGEDAARPIEDRIMLVNLARIAVEHACLSAMQDIQRALGLGAFVRPHPVERILRDLMVYLRQPAPDAVMTEAGAHWMRAPAGSLG